MTTMPAAMRSPASCKVRSRAVETITGTISRPNAAAATPSHKYPVLVKKNSAGRAEKYEAEHPEERRDQGCERGNPSGSHVQSKSVGTAATDRGTNGDLYQTVTARPPRQEGNTEVANDHSRGAGAYQARHSPMSTQR